MFCTTSCHPYCKVPQMRSENLANFAFLLFLSPISPSLQLIRSASNLIILIRTALVYAFKNCTSFPFSKHNTYFLNTALALATPKYGLAHTVNECRALRTVKVLTAVRRRRNTIHCLVRVEIAVSLLEKIPCTCKKATSAQLWSPVQFFWIPL